MSNAVHPFFHDFPAKQKYVIQILFFFICEKNEKNSAQLSVSVTSYTNILLEYTFPEILFRIGGIGLI